MSVTIATPGMAGSLSSRRGSGPGHRCDRLHRLASRPRAARARRRRARDGAPVARREGARRARCRARSTADITDRAGDAARRRGHRARVPRRRQREPARCRPRRAAARQRRGHAHGARRVPGRGRRAGRARLVGRRDRAGPPGRRARRAPRARAARSGSRTPTPSTPPRSRRCASPRAGSTSWSRPGARARAPATSAGRRPRSCAASCCGGSRPTSTAGSTSSTSQDVAAGLLLCDEKRRDRRALHPRHAQLHVAAAVRRARAALGRRGPAGAAARAPPRSRSPRRRRRAPGPTLDHARRGARGGALVDVPLGEGAARAGLDDARRTRTPSRRPCGTTRSGSATGCCATAAASRSACGSSGGAVGRAAVSVLYRCRTPTNRLCACGRVARELRRRGDRGRRAARAVAQVGARRGRRADRPGPRAAARDRPRGDLRLAPHRRAPALARRTSVDAPALSLAGGPAVGRVNAARRALRRPPEDTCGTCSRSTATSPAGTTRPRGQWARSWPRTARSARRRRRPA